MSFSIIPYDGNSPMKLWPSLAGKAFYLKYGAGLKDRLFFYDSPPQGDSAIGGIVSPAPVIVLIHGLGDEADSWRRLIPLLNSRGFRVLAPDLPGFGRSVASGKINLKNHAAAVLTLIGAAAQSSVQNGRGVFLAGNSMGAMVAETAVLKKPELVKGLILVDGSIPGGPSNPGPFVLAKLLFSRKWYRSYRENHEGAWASLRPYYADLSNLPLEDRDFLKSRVVARVESAAQERAFFQTQTSLIMAYITSSSRFARGIRDFPGKILLLWGEKDRILPPASAQPFKALRGDIEMEIISGAGHLPQQEKPEETARLMTDFASGR